MWSRVGTNRAELQAHSKLTVPVLASGGGAQTLAKNYQAMCEEIAENVTGRLVPNAGHWVAEEQPDSFVRAFLDFDARARNAQPSSTGAHPPAQSCTV